MIHTSLIDRYIILHKTLLANVVIYMYTARTKVLPMPAHVKLKQLHYITDLCCW